MSAEPPSSSASTSGLFSGIGMMDEAEGQNKWQRSDKAAEEVKTVGEEKPDGEKEEDGAVEEEAENKAEEDIEEEAEKEGGGLNLLP